MNKQQAQALMRLSQHDDFAVLVNMVDENKEAAQTSLTKLVDTVDIYRMQGECRGYDKVRDLFETAVSVVKNC